MSAQGQPMEATSAGPLLVGLDQCSASVAQLHDRLTHLEARLDPLVPNAPELVAPETAHDRPHPPVSRTTRQVLELGQGIASAVDRLERLASRIEV